MQRCLTMALLLLVGLTIPCTTGAEVVGWEIIKARGYEQTSNSAPTTPSINIFFAGIDFDTPSGITGVSLEGAPGGSIPFSPEGFPLGIFWETELDFPNDAALDAAIPSGNTYSIDVETSTGTVSEPIALSGGYPTPIPFFSGTLYETLQGFDSSQDLTLFWDNVSGTNVTGVEIFIEDVSGDFDVIDEENPPLNSTFISGGTLEPGKEYVAGLIFFNEADDPRDSFSSGDGLSGHAVFTEIFFTTALIPEPTSLLLVLMGLASLLKNRRS